MKVVRLWLQVMRISLSSMLAYRMDVVLRTLGMVVMIAVMVFVLGLPFENVDEIAGWKRYEVLVVLGFYYVSSGLAWVLFRRGLSRLEWRINSGRLDDVLLKPVSSRFLLAFLASEVDRIGDIIVGGYLITQAFVLSDTNFEFVNLVVAVFSLVGGLGVVFGIFLMANTLSFWTTEAYMDHVVSPLIVVSKYPVDIWGRAKSILYWVLPVGFVSTVPASILLDKLDIWWGWVSLLIGIFWVFISGKFWGFGVKNYSSVGG